MILNRTNLSQNTWDGVNSTWSIWIERKRGTSYPDEMLHLIILKGVDGFWQLKQQREGRELIYGQIEPDRALSHLGQKFQSL